MLIEHGYTLVIPVSGSSAVRHGGGDHQVQGAATRVPVRQDTQPGTLWLT